jgi:predicted GH43/DUF377 family glycosyl hydrolase
MLPWVRYEKNPVFPVIKGTWRNSWTANPDILIYKDKFFLYYRGQGADGKDRIGVMTVDKDKFDGINFIDHPNNPIIDVGAPGTFDSKYVLDPAAVEIDGKIRLYYSGISGTYQEGEFPDSIGLAVSEDGYHFTKHGTPLFTGRSPEVVYKDGKFYMIYLKSTHRGYFINGLYEIWLAISDDGIHFEDYGDRPILPSGKDGEWDSYGLTTPRLLYEDGIYFLIYAGDDTHYDYSKNFGLAASRDLINWTKYSGNPIYHRGEPGTSDEGGIWFPAFIKVNGTYYMWYEGYGQGKDRDKAFDEPGFSQIHLATLAGINLKDLFKDKQI